MRESFAAVNADVCSAIGPLAVPLFGDEIGLEAVRVPELGHVGSPLPSAPAAIEDALAAGLVPVVAPLGVGPAERERGRGGRRARGRARRRQAPLRHRRSRACCSAARSPRRSGVAEAERLLDAGELGGGIVPKLQAAVAATRGGVDATIGATAVVA